MLQDSHCCCRNSRLSVAPSIVVMFIFTSAAHAQSAFVRVNQVGYVSGASKRAYLMASASETGATFSVQNSSGQRVFGPAAIGAMLGSWSSSYPDVYALDFDSFTTTGTYTISVSGPIVPSSPSFKIDSAMNLYTTPLSWWYRSWVISIERRSIIRLQTKQPMDWCLLVSHERIQKDVGWWLVGRQDGFAWRQWFRALCKQRVLAELLSCWRIAKAT